MEYKKSKDRFDEVYDLWLQNVIDGFAYEKSYNLAENSYIAKYGRRAYKNYAVFRSMKSYYR